MKTFGRFTIKGLAVSAAALLAFASAPAVIAQGTGYWHTTGNEILDSNNQRVRIAGINWYGFETSTEAPGGLWAQDYKAILQTVKNLGYNTVRIPFSNQMVETPIVPSNISYNNGNGAINSDLQGLNSLQILDKMVNSAGTLGLKVILDDHRSEAGNSAESNGLWYTSSYPESAWISDWTNLASRYNNNPTVIGFDLRNEPHNAYSGGACWDCGGTNDWHDAAERAGNAVLAINPKLLIFVEGTDAYNNDYYWWGGNLEGVKNSPVVLSVQNQLVYSAHDYGPTEYGQSWFNGSTTSASLASVWTNHWGYIDQNNIAPVWLGEFGTTNDAASVSSTAAGSEGQWFQSMVSYLKNEPTLNWTYWALNGEDHYGLLDSNYDATPANAQKQSTLATIQFPLSAGTTTSAPKAPSNLSATATSSSQVNLSWTASSTSGVTYTIYFGTNSGSTTTVLASNVNGTTYSATNLNASTTYHFTVQAVNSAGTSNASNQASATTQAASAPAAPTNLTASASSSSQINLSWTASTTSGVKYTLYSGTNPNPTAVAISGVTGTTYSAAGLNASTTYYFLVKAISSSGTVSNASNQASAQTQSASAGNGGCHVNYVDQNDWGSGFTANLSITNTSSTALKSWALTWTYAGNQQITQSWNGNYTQSGKSVTITNASWNGSIAAGATLSGIGFNANYSGTNHAPTLFYVNGVLCK